MIDDGHLRDAEVRERAAGLSHRIDANLREGEAAAERELIAAQVSYFRALADYRASVGDLPAS